MASPPDVVPRDSPGFASFRIREIVVRGEVHILNTADAYDSGGSALKRKDDNDYD